MYGSTTATWVISAKFSCNNKRSASVSHSSPRVAHSGSLSQGVAGGRRRAANEGTIFVHRERGYSGTNRNLALGGHMDAEAVSVVREAGVAGDNTVAVDVAETQRIRPVRASILERD